MPANHNKSTQKKHKATKPATHHLVSKKLIIGSIFILLLVINVMLVGVYTKVQNLSEQTNTVMAVNQERTYGDVTVLVSNVKKETEYIMGIIPTDSEKIISLQLSITNNSKTSFEIYPAAQSFIRDNQGVTYYMAPVALDDPFEAKTLLPGESESGTLSYLVTNRTLPLLYYIENRQSNIGPFVVKLQ